MDTDLSQIAARTDEAIARARAELVQAVRQAAAEGMTQAEIAHAIGRSQPEVSRLIHFHGSTPRALALRRSAVDIRREIATVGGSDVRVFGSVATGSDDDESDIDLVFTPNSALSLMSISRLERRLAAIVGVPVDLIPEDALRPDLRDRVLREAVPI